MPSLQSFHTVSDFRREAQRRLPRFAFDFIDGGAGSESALRLNESSFQRIRLTPRIGIDPGKLDMSTSLLDKVYSVPFGIAPLGLCGIVHPNADIQFAQLAKQFNFPYITSATASRSVEDVASAIGEAPWFQLYAPKSTKCMELLVERVNRLGCPVMVVTVDTAAPGKRIRDLQNGLTIPFKPSLKNVLEAVKHPLWTARRLAAGTIEFPNLARPEELQRTLPFNQLMAWQIGGSLDWETLLRIRQQWPRKLLLKGVLSVADAKLAESIGVDGIIISNHGGRQLDCAPCPIDVLPDFVAAGFGAHFLSLDSGIRCGEDIVKALAFGAGYVFIGRPFLYALAAKGERGAEYMFELLKLELQTALQLAGLSSTTISPTMSRSSG